MKNLIDQIGPDRHAAMNQIMQLAQDHNFRIVGIVNKIDADVGPTVEALFSFACSGSPDASGTFAEQMHGLGCMGGVVESLAHNFIAAAFTDADASERQDINRRAKKLLRRGADFARQDDHVVESRTVVRGFYPEDRRG